MPTHLAPLKVQSLVQQTLERKKLNYGEIIDSFGQVSAVGKRVSGKRFELRDHIKGLVYSLLSNSRPWKTIEPNLSQIDEIFLQYNPEKLESADSSKIVSEIRAIKCGNRDIKRQIESLPHNIQVLRTIQSEIEDEFFKYTGLEDNGTKVDELVRRITKDNSRDKLKQVGTALAMEYLRNIGIRGMKPDRHLLRICGRERLGILTGVDENTTNQQKLLEAQKEFIEFAKQISNEPEQITYLDNLFWLFGADKYGAICTAKPKCNECLLKGECNYKS